MESQDRYAMMPTMGDARFGGFGGPAGRGEESYQPSGQFGRLYDDDEEDFR